VRRPFQRYFTSLLLLTALASYACATAARPATAGKAPTPEQPRYVRVGVVIRNIIGIDEVKENWQVNGLLVAKWNDPSLRYRPRGREQLSRELPTNVWKPDFEFTNEDSTTNFYFVDLYVQPDGTVTSTQRFTATLGTNSDLRRFPFDSQVLPLVVQASGDDLDSTILTPDRKGTSLSNRGYVQLAQWKPLSLTERVGTVAGSARHAKDIEFLLKVQRNPKSYILKFIVPLLLLVMISWVTFWLSHEEFKARDQLQSAVATLLIVVAFNITVSNLLPRTEYVTYIDALLFTCFIFVIIAIGAIVVTHLLQIKHSEKLALFVRRLSGIVLPVTFLVTQAVLFFAFHIAG
jgi:Neurotransmitter-gated ion-channel ligand binding domain